MTIKSDDFGNAVRDVLMKRVKEGRGVVDPAVEEVTEVLFTDEVDEATGTNAIWYSERFEGGKEYIDNSGRPDLDISKLCFEEGDWDKVDRIHIPKIDENYIWQHEALYAIVQGQLLNMKTMLVGDTGTGKSKLHENLAAVYKQPFYRLNGRGDMESDTILGRVDIENGSTTFLLGEFTKRFVKGYYILLDEPWKLPASINMALQRPLERDGILQIDDMKGDLIDKQFAPHPRTLLTLADNVIGTGDDDGRFAATMVQDSSTLNRIDLVVPLDYLPAPLEKQMIIRRFPQIPDRQASRAVQVANLIREGCRSGQLSVTMSPRNIIAWMELATKSRSYEHGFIYTMLNRYADHNERDAIINFWETVYGSPLV